jgi:thymidine phosphorylase
MGGPADFIDRAGDYLPAAPVTRGVFATGIVTSMDTRAIGNAIVELGGGRRRVGDAIDLAVGIESVAPIGSTVDASRPLAIVHARTEADAERAEAALTAAIQTGDDAPPARKVVYDILTAGA